MFNPRVRFAVAASLLLVPAVSARSQQIDTSLYHQLRWRMIGPFRGSRTKAAAGVPQQPNVFYIGAVNGGVWKTTDYGRTWNPIFDDEPTGSIGAIAVAPSDPDIVYVGSGEGLQRPDLSTGDGIYRSADAGTTWTHLGLRDGQQIPQIIVDPRDPNRLFVAVLGHPYGPNTERGIFRSTDGGKSFEKVLYKNENTGGIDIAFDPANANTVYAVLWEARQAPWENGVFSGPGSGLFKSTDGGSTWTPIGKGLPTFAEGLGRIGIGIAPSLPSRMFATVELSRGSALYRSDDAGENWYKVTDDERVSSRASDFAEVKVDPKNADVVYTANVVTWKSTDGGKTFHAFRGAPGGDDYQRTWINPVNPDVMLVASDQGAIVTVNGGQSWSTWYNQPTAAMYHVNADNAFPYRLCSGQQESGSACIRSRGDDGAITMRDWHPVGVEEYGYAVPDPLNPDLVYGGKVSRYDRRTGEVQNVGPNPLRRVRDYRTVRTAPLVFSTVDPHALYFGSNVVWKTTSGGQRWTRISPDLTRRYSAVPPNVGVYASTRAATARHPGVVYTIAPSYVSIDRIWAGSDDGLIHTTTDGGKHWTDVTPTDLRDKPWSKISIIDAGRFDAATAYAAVNTIRLDDLHPHIYRTHDGGRTWTQIVNGIADGATINTVREDPKRKGLLFAGSETQVWVSFDDGDHWSSLRLNMPATSVRDLIVKDNDLAVGTHGRGFWILDDISPLRRLTASVTSQPAALFAPAPAWRFRWNKNTDTPFPPDEPMAANPPDGAIIDYWIGGRDTSAAHEAKLDIIDSTGRVIRTYSSRDTATPPADIGNTPAYWIRPTRVLSSTPGMHRFVWDLHWTPPAGTGNRPGGYPISATPHDTPREPRGPFALAGRYTVRLTVDGKAYVQPLLVRMDPRVKTPPAVIARAHATAVRLYDDIARDSAAVALLRASGDQRDPELIGSLTSINGGLMAALAELEQADVAPTTQLMRQITQIERDFAQRMARFNARPKRTP